MKGIYFDNSFTTKPAPAAVSRMIPYLTERYGVYSQPHKVGQSLEAVITESYQQLYALFRAKEDDTILFTSSGAEAVNQVILGAYLNISIPTGKNHFAVSKADEAPAIMSVGRLETFGCIGTMIKTNEEGIITPQAIAESLTPRTALVSLSWGNGLTGVIQPVQEISKILKERGVKFHLDASHVLGKLYFDLEHVGADYITLSGDLIHGPKSSGALWIKAKETLPPFIVGGLEQNGLRAGPLDTASLAGLAEAAKEARETEDFMAAEVARLRAKFEKMILKKIPSAKILFKGTERLPHISAVLFPGCASEALLFELNRMNLFASMGGGSMQQISHVLQASGMGEIDAASSLSFSFSRETTDEEIDRGTDIIQDCVNRLQKASKTLL